MEKFQYNLFSVPICNYSNVLTTQQCIDICKFVECNPAYDANYDLITSIQNNILSCSDLYQKIKFIANDFSKSIGIDINVEPHDFSTSLFLNKSDTSIGIIKCVLFLNVVDETVTFTNPNRFLNYLNLVFFGVPEYKNKASIHNKIYPNHVVKVKNGDLLLFPNWVAADSNNLITNSPNNLTIDFYCSLEKWFPPDMR